MDRTDYPRGCRVVPIAAELGVELAGPPDVGELVDIVTPPR
jgi:hypothetical protein